jgi:hypothetical protein
MCQLCGFVTPIDREAGCAVSRLAESSFLLPLLKHFVLAAKTKSGSMSFSSYVSSRKQSGST